jgi:hypothetical protein
MVAYHDCPTRYYVGRAMGGGVVFADFPEGRGKPRYQMFASEFEARADAARRHHTLTLSGNAFRYDLKFTPPED